jgi:hypothetical protein
MTIELSVEEKKEVNGPTILGVVHVVVFGGRYMNS